MLGRASARPPLLLLPDSSTRRDRLSRSAQAALLALPLPTTPSILLRRRIRLPTRRLHLLRREVLPLAPAVEVDQGLHAAPFHDLALEPDEVDGLGGGLVFIFSSFFDGVEGVMGGGRTLVKKSLHPDANAS